MVFDHYFAKDENGQQRRQFPSLTDVNRSEMYYLPNMMNPQRCEYVRYGEKSIGNVLTERKIDPVTNEAISYA